MMKSKQLPGQLDLFDAIGIVPQNIVKKNKKYCSLCDGHRGCDNCYYGQIETKICFDACEDCDIKTMTEWRSLGDNYCRNCGRKLQGGE